MAALDNATLDMSPEPVVPVNEPVAAELPPPLPQLQAGELPAVLVPPITQELMASDPTIDAIVNNFPKLGELGIEYYEAGDLSTVLYNPASVTLEQLQEADQNGTLNQIAMPLGAAEGEQQSTPTPGPQNAPLAAEQAPAAPASEQRLQTARVQNMAPRPVSPIQPRPVTGQLAKRPI